MNTNSTPVYQKVFDVSWMELVLTKHARHKVRQRGLSMLDILDAFEHPDTTYSTYGHGNQLRVSGKNIVLIGQPVGNKFEVITVYSRSERWGSDEKAEYVAEARRLKDVSARRAAAAATVFAACHR